MMVLPRLVLPADVIIAPAADLPDSIRAQVDPNPGDFTVARARSRTTSSVVSADTAALLEAFRTPATIVDAVIAFSAAQHRDPRATLEEAFDCVKVFVDAGLLVAAGSALAEPIATTMQPGERIAGLLIEEPVHLVVDLEVLRARAADGSTVALKIARAAADAGQRASLGHEAAILDCLDGRVNPSPAKPRRA